MQNDILPDSTLYLIRHATPDWSRRDLLYHEPPGPPLTERGQAEAKALGVYLSEVGVCYLYASPLERCQHTAKIVAMLTGASVQIDHRLIEWQPEEAPDNVRERMLAFVSEISLQGAKGGHIGLVTHGGPIAMLLSGLGMDDITLKSWRKFDHANPLPPAGVWRAMRDRMDVWGLEFIFQPSLETYDNLGVTRVSPSQYKA